MMFNPKTEKIADIAKEHQIVLNAKEPSAKEDSKL